MPNLILNRVTTN